MMIRAVVVGGKEKLYGRAFGRDILGAEDILAELLDSLMKQVKKVYLQNESSVYCLSR